MNSSVDGKPAAKTGRGRKILWGVFAGFLLLGFLLNHLDPSGLVWEVLTFTFLIGPVVLLILLSITSKKYYNWTVVLLTVFLFVNIVSKSFNVGYLAYFLSGLIAFSLFTYFSIRSFVILKHNPFLKWLGFASSLTLGLFIITSLLKSLTKLFVFDVLFYAVIILLIIIILTLIFKLPGVNYSTWLPLDMKIFYRQIIIPLIMIFSFSILFNVFPDVYDRLFRPDFTGSPWNMEDIELYDLEGIEQDVTR